MGFFLCELLTITWVETIFS